MLDSDPQDIVLSNLALANCGGRVFSIGPIGVRVGFAYQQERALDLIYALIKKRTPPPSSRFLVVGGGLAGMTASLALRGAGYPDVRLVEQLDRLVKTQHDATHRMVHPCYNNWPFVDYFSPTTNFPFLNWYSDKAAAITDFLSKRWDELYSKICPPVDYNVSLLELKLVKSKNGAPEKINVETVNNKTGHKITGKYDYIILAMGFGPESGLISSDSPSYWRPDQIRSISQEQSKKTIFVSGIGDGGLMDFIRSGYTIPSENDLALELISKLRADKYHSPRTDMTDDKFQRSALEDDIKKIEETALQKLLAGKITNAPYGSKSENQVALYLHDEYDRICELLSPQLTTHLTKRVNQALIESGRLKLYGKLQQPFTCRTAPINKLLVAFLLRHARQNKLQQLYERGKYLGQDKVSTSGTRRAFENFDGSTVDAEDHYVFVRHGGNPPVYKHDRQLRNRMSRLDHASANLKASSRSESVFCINLGGILSCDESSPQYLTYRRTLIDEIARKFLRTKISTEYDRYKEKPVLVAKFHRSDIDDVEEIAGRLGGFPHDLFGIRLIGTVGATPRPGTGTRR